MPWKKFVRADATAALTAGANTIAIETVHYVANPNGMATADAPPMIATLVVEYADGSMATFVERKRLEDGDSRRGRAGSRRASTMRRGRARWNGSRRRAR